MATEQPVYTTELHDGAIELRTYPPSIVAEVTVGGNQREAARKGFRLLAAYIFGGNQRRERVAMTAPVAQLPVDEQFRRTGFPGQSRAANDYGEAWVVRFTMPRGYQLAQLPTPSDATVQLRVLPATRYAALRFSGRATQEDFESHTAELKAWLPARHLQAAGTASLAQYNPPWTLWFLRRNEVLIPVAR